VPGKPDIIDNPHHVSASDQVIRKILRFFAVGLISFDKYSGEICGRTSCHADHRPSTLHQGIGRGPADAL